MPGLIIDEDGRRFRIRRGRMVEIPDEWSGKTVWDQTKNRRRSRIIHKRRKTDGWKRSVRNGRRPPPEE